MLVIFCRVLIIEVLFAPWKIEGYFNVSEEEQRIDVVMFLDDNDHEYISKDVKFQIIDPPLIHSIGGTQILQNRWYEIGLDSTFHERDRSVEVMILPYDVTERLSKHAAGEEYSDLQRLKDIKKYLLRPIRINVLRDTRETMLCDKPYIPATVKRAFPVCNVEEEVDKDDKNKWCEEGFFQDKFKTETIALDVKSVFCGGDSYQATPPTIVSAPEVPLTRYTHENYGFVYDHVPYFQYFQGNDRQDPLMKGNSLFQYFRHFGNVTISSIPNEILTHNAIHKITNHSDKINSNVNDFDGKPRIIEGSEFEFDMEIFYTERINDFKVTIPTKNANVGDSFYVEFSYKRGTGALEEDSPRIGLFQVVTSDETCLAGYVCDESLDNSIVQCPKGFYCQNGVKNQCPNGFIAENVGQETCTACAAGLLSSENNIYCHSPDKLNLKIILPKTAQKKKREFICQFSAMV
eukprot:Pgem_evm2s9130